MDQERLEELTKKRNDVGLTKEEADELGRLMAEAAGEEHRTADNPPPEVAVARDAALEEKAAKGEMEEDELAERDVDETVESPERKAGEQKDAPPPA